MKIEFEGTVYDFDERSIRLKQAVKIEKHIGGTLGDWEDGLANASAPCLQALAWLIFHGGDATPIDDVDFELLPFAEAVLAGMTAEAEAGDAVDPTSAPSPPRAGTSASGAPRTGPGS